MDYVLQEYQEQLHEQILLFDNEIEPSFGYDFAAYLMSDKARLRYIIRRAIENQLKLNDEYGGNDAS